MAPKRNFFICKEMLAEFDLKTVVYCSKFFFMFISLCDHINKSGIRGLYLFNYVIMVEPFLLCHVICYLFIIITLHLLL